MSRLNPILSFTEFAKAELCALRLDGETIALDDCAVPIDEIAGPALRAAVLAEELPPRLIAALHSAAWVWGAADRPPSTHEVCAANSARTRPAPGTHLRVREVVIDSEDIIRLGTLDITTPLRTAIDLARFIGTWSSAETLIIARLMRFGGFEMEDCERAMNRRRNLPGKRTALARLGRVQPLTASGGSLETNAV